MNQHKSLSTIINKLQRKELLLHMEYNYEKETSSNKPKRWASTAK